MAVLKKIYRGATFEDSLGLRLQDPATGVVNPFAIEPASVVEVRFPGESSTVVLSTANVGEVTVLDADASTISYVGAPAKSDLLEVSESMTIDVVVIQGSSGKVIAFQLAKYAVVADLAAP